MPQRMLIDATRPGETRVVVLNGDRVEEFDYETATKTQVKGNIYLAKVTRVEPSLQAAFVEYGGNRHGFLPFSEIHPDYYRLPVADREQLLAAEAGQLEEQPPASGEVAPAEGEDDAPESAMDRALDQEVPEEPEQKSEGDNGNGQAGNGAKLTNGHDEEHGDEGSIDTLDGDEIDEVAQRRAQFLRKYKIQEVIKRRQVMLVQVTKEERGTKGAALTTYLSLAGRYCVLMPNTAKGGGISRKISNAADRKRLKEVVSQLDIPEGMAVIVRTAGSQRTRAEIRRDYEYLLRLWDEIRNKTLESSAPSLIHEEANLIKRAVRDIYTRDMVAIEVEGEEGYKTARAVMRMLIPSHARKVTQYKDPSIPLFAKYRVEEQLEAMHAHTVQLRSGGSIVLNPTEALVAIDVNSGKATSERHIEETAFKTNLEAADEIARQLRLRDLAGLIVIDFIDMEDPRHIREVERRLKEAMKLDRARIQLGRISPFGLLELSRQRLRPSLFETVNVVCPTCRGLGHLRSPNSLSLTLLNQVTDEAVRRGPGQLEVHAPVELALYVLNEKRSNLRDIEERFGVEVFVRADENLGAQEFVLRRLTSEGRVEERRIDVQKTPAVQAEAESEEKEQEKRSSARSRRRNGRGRNGRLANGHANGQLPAQAQESAEEAAEAGEEETSAEGATPTPMASDSDEERSSKRRRRGRRGGRRRRGRREGQEVTASEETQQSQAEGDEEAAQDTDETGETLPAGEPAAAEAPSEAVEMAGAEARAAELAASRAESVSEPPADEAEVADEAAGEASSEEKSEETEQAEPERQPARRSRSRRSRKSTTPAAAESEPEEEVAASDEADGAAPAEEEGKSDEQAAREAPKQPRRRTSRRKVAAKAEEETPRDVDQPGELASEEEISQKASALAESSEEAAPTREPEPEKENGPADPPEAEAEREAEREPQAEAPHNEAEAQPEPKVEPEPEPEAEREAEVVADEPPRPVRRGWWSRRVN